MSFPRESTARPHVTAVIVAHDGAAWIPHLIETLEASTRFPDQLVAVDTGSVDDSAKLLREALGEQAVVDAAAETGFGAAVRIGLDAVHPGTDVAGSWIWLLHDDCAPATDALERLLATAAREDDVAVVGCRVRAWPRGRRLLEVGVTITGTGRRRTGLEPGEYDQGQHDTVRDALSVSSAGMLVRRDVWDRLHGFDPRLPLFRDDVDFGWRVARAGHRVVVAPDAVLHHAEGASRGVRRIASTSPRPHQADRQAALYTLLANCSALAFPLQLVRLAVGTLLRATGFLLGKLPSAASDEIRALGHVLGHPVALVGARRARRRTSSVSARRVRPLLPSWWSPYSDGAESLLEAGSGVLRARAARSAPFASRLRASRRDATALETGPVSDDAIGLPVGVSPWLWVLSHPLLSLVVGLVVATLAGARGLWGSGLLQGGALLPPPADAAEWLSLYGESWHPVQLGSTEVPSPYVAVLGVLGTVLLDNAWLVVDVLMLFAVAVSAVGAFVVSRRLVSGMATRVWMTVTYALLPVVSGAVGSGHFGTVVTLILLPWLLRSALRLVETSSWRPVFGSGLLLAVVVAFAPIAWLLVAAVVLVFAVWGLLRGRAGVVVRAGVAVLLPLVLLLPWSSLLLADPAVFLTEAGVVRASDADPGWTVLFGRLDAAGDAPVWLTAGVMVAALAALLRTDRRVAVARAWVVIAVALVAAASLAGRTVGVPGTTGDTPVWLGVPVIWAQAAAVVAAGVGADGLVSLIRSGSFGWRQPVAGVVVLLATAAPLCALAWWVVGAPVGDLTRGPASSLPAYMVDATQRDIQQRVLVVTGEQDLAEYELVADDGLRLGDDSVLPEEPDDELTALVRVLLSQADASDVSRLADLGIEYVVLPQPADPAFVAALDSTVGLSRASTTERQLLGWQLDADVGLVRLLDPTDAAPEASAEALPAPRGVVDTDIVGGGEGRLVLVASTTGGFVATLDGAELAAAETESTGQAFLVGEDAGRLQVEYDGDRTGWLVVQLVAVLGCLLLAAPSLDRRQGVGRCSSEPG
jgi:GT2 family glycosyltransferase